MRIRKCKKSGWSCNIKGKEEEAGDERKWARVDERERRRG